MNLQHVNVKVFVDEPLDVDLERFIVAFHQWIVDSSMAEMLIDVADYRHVPQGPAVMLIGHEADYSLDHREGRYGLLYNRKAPLEGTNSDRFLHSLRAAAKACLLLESQVPGVRFRRDEFELFINDRALAPNTPQTREIFEAELSAFLERDLGQTGFRFRSSEDPRLRVGAVVSLISPLELERLSEAH
jgi:hypothetical protein